MEIEAHYLTPPHRCSYLPGQTAMLEYVDCRAITTEEYGRLLEQGWRRFGRSLFRPRCPSCSACQSLRIRVDEFEPSRSQRRNIRENEEHILLRMGDPTVSDDRLKLHDAFHQFQSSNVGWQRHPPKDVATYYASFVDNPFPTEEWCYYLKGKLVGVGYVDAVPNLGLSAIYFFHEPRERDRGLGTWNILNVIDEARRRGLPYVYLGYFVSGCRSLEYKERFRPHEVLTPLGQWQSR
jgi:arginine-tRNA-protein transferase